MVSQQESQPFSDLRVIDLSHGIAGPYCTKLLADFGADVIKIERPDVGDYARNLGPFPSDQPHPEKSGIFLHLNTNKRSVTLNLKDPESIEVVKSLIQGADILIESFRPGVMSRLGLAYETLQEINPKLIMTSISNFGQTGPYRDYLASELVLYGMGGRMTAAGLPDRHPLKLGGNHVQYQAGNNAAMATLFAWFAIQRSGQDGQYVDLSIFETQMASINQRLVGLMQYQYNGERGKRLGPIRGGYPSGPYPCLDGYISVTGGGARWGRTTEAIGMPELRDDPRFAPPLGQQDLDAREEFEGTIWLPWLLERTQQEVVTVGQDNEMLIAPILTIDNVVDNNPQLDFREYFVDIDHPIAGKIKYPGSPIFNNNNWWKIRRPAPLLGEHNKEVLQQELGYSPEKIERVTGYSKDQNPSNKAANKNTQVTSDATKIAKRGKTTKDGLPLDGIRVIDMAVIYAGPYSTMFLGDMGAEVIRVESMNQLPATSRGQFARVTKESQINSANSPYPDRDPGERPWNRAANFNQHARNKYGISLDLKGPHGLETFRKLVEVSDIFIENNASGTMKRLGVDYSVVSKWNPRLIMISICGFGQTGPWSHYRGIGTQFEAATGHASVTGYPNMDAEGIPASVAADASTGVTIVLAAQMALKQREKTGKGCFVDIALGENFMPHLGEIFMDYTINGRAQGTPGNRDHLGSIVQGAYPCDGDDEWIAISIDEIKQWHSLCQMMGKQELVEDPKFEDMASLRTNHDEIDRIIGTWTSDREPIALFHDLQRNGIPAGYLIHEEHAYNDPHLKDRDFFVSITAPEVGTYLHPGTTYGLSKTPFVVHKPPVRMGEDNDYVYRDVLGLTEEEYDTLKNAGQITMDYAPHVK